MTKTLTPTKVTPAEQRLLDAFRSMDGQATETIMRIAARMAEDWPRDFVPEPGLDCGGAA